MSCQPTPTPCSDCTQTLIDISNYCTDECVEKIASKCVYYDGEDITTSVMHITTNESLTDVIKELTKNSADLAVDLTYNATTRQLCLTKNGSPVRCFTIAETGYYMVLTPENSLQLWRQVLPSGPDVMVDQEDLSITAADPSVLNIAALAPWDRGTHAMVFVRDWLRGGWFTWNSSGNTDNVNTYDAFGGGYWIRNNSFPGFANVCWGGCNPSLTATQNTVIIQNLINLGYRRLDVPGNILYNRALLVNREYVIIEDALNSSINLTERAQLRFLNPPNISTDAVAYIEPMIDRKGLRIVADSTQTQLDIMPQIEIGATEIAFRGSPVTLHSGLGNAGAGGTPTAKTDGATTVSVAGGNTMAFADSSSTLFTGFTGGTVGQFVLCTFSTSFTTFVNSSTLKVGTANFTPIAGDIVLFYIGNGAAYKLGSTPQIKSGSTTASGDGATTTFQIAHNLTAIPTYFTVTPTTPDAAGLFYVGVDATNINVIYLTAPDSGVDNLKWKVGAKL